MIRALIAAALIALVPTIASAEGLSTACQKIATTMNFAAQFRDSNMSPQQVYQQMQIPNFRQGISEEQLKDEINTVFFDQDASSMSGGQIYSAIVHSCMFPKKTYQPLN
jgi:hypothetical protein